VAHVSSANVMIIRMFCSKDFGVFRLA
jgi:hypothetical protein